MNITDDSEFETHDIYLAAYLSEAGCELKRRRKQGTRVHFAFTNVTGSVKELREAFFSGKGMVSAAKYADAIRKFKEMCYLD